MRINHLAPATLPLSATAQRHWCLVKLKRSLRCLTTRLSVLGLAAMLCCATTVSVAAPGNVAEQWNQNAENTVVNSGAFQAEGLIYMAYVSAAVYNASVAINGHYAPLGTGVTAAEGSSTDAAIIEAAYDTLVHYFPAQSSTLYQLYSQALNGIQPGTAKSNGQAVGLAAAASVIALRTGDGRLTPIATTSSFTAKTPGPGVWRLTPPAYAAPQTPWVGDVKPFVLHSADQFLPDPPPELGSDDWVTAFQYLEAYGALNSSVRTAQQTTIARFWTANVIRTYNRIVRDVADARGLNSSDTVRLAAMVNVIAADAAISMMHAKYHYLFWRPVTAIDPSSVKPGGDGFGPVPGYSDGNQATTEQLGWRPLIVTPNHPEFPSAHTSLTAAVIKTLSQFLGTDEINLDVHGFDPTGPAGNLNAVQHFATADDLLQQVSNARAWGGLHYPFSLAAGLRLGRQVADYDVHHAFQLTDE